MGFPPDSWYWLTPTKVDIKFLIQKASPSKHLEFLSGIEESDYMETLAGVNILITKLIGIGEKKIDHKYIKCAEEVGGSSAFYSIFN